MKHCTVKNKYVALKVHMKLQLLNVLHCGSQMRCLDTPCGSLIELSCKSLSDFLDPADLQETESCSNAPMKNLLLHLKRNKQRTSEAKTNSVC
jgi:hypothetical protein